MAHDEDHYFPDDLPAFALGQLVRHRRYGYRGVVVDFDMRCRAGDDWYKSNQTRPKRDQPWYHVLVDGSTAVTYAAQTSLHADPEARPITHALVEHFFESFDPSRPSYERNETPWPAEWE